MSTLSSLVFVPFKDISCLASCLGMVCLELVHPRICPVSCLSKSIKFSCLASCLGMVCLELVHSRICLSRSCPLFLPQNCPLNLLQKTWLRSEEVRAYNVVCALDDTGLKVWRLCARAPHHHAQGHLLLHDKIMIEKRENLTRFQLFMAIYTVKIGYRHSRLQSGCHLPISLGGNGTGM
jgi:hypothetical protein